MCVQGCLSVPDALPPDQLGALRELLTEMQIKCVDGTQPLLLAETVFVCFWQSRRSVSEAPLAGNVFWILAMDSLAF